MNIVYSSSDLFSEITAVSIVSLLENNPNENIHIYIIDNNITEENKAKLDRIVHSHNQKIDYVPIPDIEALVGRKIEVGRWNISTFGRCFLGSILPESVEKLIFIDADTIVRHSLKKLYQIDMKDKLVLGTDDCRGGAYRTNLDVPEKTNYINCGLMLVNLKKWREMKIENEFIKFINDKNADITYMDQGVINGVLGAKQLTGLIHPKYNCQRLFFDFTYDDIMKIRKPSFHHSREIYEEAIKDPIVVHFTTCFITGTRPWNEKDKHPYKEEFLMYKQKTPWGSDVFWPDNRKKMKKLMTVACNILPKSIMISTISIVHTKLYPWVRNIKMK